MNEDTNTRGKTASAAGTISSGASLLSGYQVCHNVCMGLIGLLSIVGITLVGMPLAFLLPYSIPFWIIGALLLLVTAAWYVQKPHCVPKHLVLFNAGILIAAIPFKELQKLQLVFWITGGMIIAFAIYGYWTKRQRFKKVNSEIVGSK